MNKTMLKILIATLILLIGAGAVSAIDNNSTDEVVSVEQTEEISVIEDNEVISVNESNNEVLSVENNDTVISVSGNDSEVLTADNNNTVISVSENNSDVLSVENTNSVISVSSDDNLTASSPFAKDPQMTQSKTQYKTFYLGKMKFLKKYKRMALYGYNIPSKKNKKAWKNHINFQKAYKKQSKQLKKKSYNVAKKAAANHWHGIGDIYYKIKYSGKYINIYFYVKCYRTYNYNPLLNKGWWD